MNSRIDFEKLAKQLKDENFDDVFETINSKYVGKSFEEIVDLISNIDNIEEIEKISAYVEKYDDELEYIDKDFKSLEEEYKTKIDEAISLQEEASRRRINYIKDYNDYNNEIETVGPVIDDTTNSELLNVERRLKEIEIKEQLLNGSLSRKMAEEKAELLSKKESLLKDQSDFEDLKNESYYLAKEEEKNIKSAQDKRNEIIGELASKKVELFKEKGSLRKLSKKYNYLMSEINKATFSKKMAIDEEYDSIKTEFEKRIASNDLNAIAEYSPKYIEISTKKIEFDNKVASLLKVFNVDKEIIDEIINKPATLLDQAAGIEPQTETTLKTENEPIKGVEIDEIPTIEEFTPVEIETPKMDETIEEIPIMEATPELEETPVVEEIKQEVEEKPIVEEIPLKQEEVISIPDQEPSLSEKILMNKKCLDSIGVKCQQIDSMYPNEKPLNVKNQLIALDRLTNIIHLTNSDLQDNLIDENSLIRTSHDNFISADLIDEYNETIDELEKLENQKGNDYEVADSTSIPVVGNEMENSQNFSIMNRFNSAREEDDEDLVYDDESEYKTKELPKPLVSNNEYGFEQPKIYQPIEPQPTEPIDLNDVMPAPQAVDANPFVLNDEDDEDELEFLPSSNQVNNGLTPQNKAQNNLQPEPIPENEVIDTKIMTDEELGDTMPINIINQQESKSKESEGIFKKIFGKKSKEESEHEIKSIVDAPESLIGKINDKLHQFMLDAEGYATWKSLQEEKQRGM